MPNNFLGDSRFKALYRFEPGTNLFKDALNNNNLNWGAVPDPVGPISGVRSLLFGGSTAIQLADANLSSNFPFKNATSNHVATFSFYFRPISGGAYQRLLTKYSGSGGGNGLIIDTYGSNLRFIPVYNGNISVCGSTLALVSNRWFHFVVEIDDVAHTATVNVKDLVTSTIQVNNFSSTYAVGIAAGDYYLGSIGGTGDFAQGTFAQFATFKRLLSTGDIAAIRANTFDFIGDSDCVALHEFNPTALLADSKSSHNDFVQLSTNAPVSNTTDFREGTGSVQLNGTETLCIADGALAAGFPFKYGDTHLKGTIILRCITSISPYSTFRLFSKAEIYLDYHSAYGGWRLVTDASHWYSSSSGLLVSGHWYTIALTIDLISLTAMFIVYDNTASTKTKTTFSPIVTSTLTQNPLSLGGTSPWEDFFNGLLDEAIFANEVLTEAEIDAINAGTFAPPPDSALSLTYCEAIPVEPPAAALSLTACPAVPAGTAPADCLSLTKCEDIPAPPAAALSLTSCEAIEFPHLGLTLSLTYCPALLKVNPEDLLSLTKCPTIPLSMGTGTYLIF